MRLAEALLENVASWQVADGRQSLTVPDKSTGWSATLIADRCDELGCQLWEMTLRRSTPFADRGSTPLRAWADRVSSRALGLLETLKLVELDAERDEALVRSTEPSQKNDRLFYYELLLKGVGEVSVRRYKAAHQAGSRREQTAYILTHEALAKLAEDLTAE